VTFAHLGACRNLRRPRWRSVARVEGKLGTVTRELQQWRALALSTAHDDIEDPAAAGLPT